MKLAPKPANSNTSTAGRWFVCRCGTGLFAVRLDERTGRNHVICEQCGDDNTMAIFA